MLDDGQEPPQQRMLDERELSAAPGTGALCREHEIDERRHDSGAQQHGRKQHDHDQHLGGLLVDEGGNAALQLGELDRLYQHAVARHFRQPSAGQVRDIP